MSTIRIMDRRDFLETLFSAGALILSAPLLTSSGQAAAGAFAASGRAAKSAWRSGLWLGIETDGTVIIITHRSEMGTGVRSTLPMIVAEELDAEWDRVKLEQAVGDGRLGSQNTDGSCSIRDFIGTMREAGATARLMLERAAAARWNVPASECMAERHEVVHRPTGKKAGFGELASEASKQPVPKKEDLKFKTPDRYRYIGKTMPTKDVEDLCQGKGTFGYDVQVPGMVYASIARSPVFGGELEDYHDGEAKKVNGVRGTAVIPPFKAPHAFQALGGVAVIADHTWAALQGRKKLKVSWKSSPHDNFASDAYRKELVEAAKKPQKLVRNVGDVNRAFGPGAKTFEADYYTPMLAHAPMEPPVAVADVREGQATLWAATQDPQAVQSAVAGALGIDKSKVTCHVTLLGGGFGRKSKPDYVCEAALLSKQLGKPVKVAWSREDDIGFDYYHAPAAMHMKAAVDAKGRPTAWLQRSVFPTIGSTFNAAARYGEEFEMGMGWTDLPFDIANHRAENGPAENHVRIGWLRSVANVYHAFAIHSFLDELAQAARRDPVEYFLDVLGADRVVLPKPEGMGHWNNGKPPEEFPIDTARLRRVVELVAEESGWKNRKNGGGQGWGFAAHRSFLSYVAVVARVEVDRAGRIRIPRMDIAADVGAVIHPDRVTAQFEGSAVFGASIALMGEITAAQGRIQQSNFHNYGIARMQEAPMETRVHLVASDKAPAGVGEPGVPPIPPALCNAVFQATGKRVRELPLRRAKLT
ncbi:MAG: xanthine dehydrogenase family protein molybdopterin-binding subunit [Verrucomicrobia bacterium]|nr:xanthine dehydrogenase family protein molybdopterin-binding subunit [Verrucomicrobiota bacterium]